MNSSFRIMALAMLVGAAACSPSGDESSADTRADTSDAVAGSTPTDQAVTNATNFHMLDFVAWNNRDMDMFRRLHTADVKVDFAGNVTNGIDAHVTALAGMWQNPGVLTNHDPVVAEGEWTCMVGVSGPPANMKMVTVAKWRGGAISEEYLLANMLKPGTAKPAVSGSPMVSISNRNADLKALVGAEPGWSCRLERTPDGKVVISLDKTGGTGADQMVFTQ
jgi:hypothetical protein